MDTVIAELIKQLPSAVAIIVVVVYFIRYIQKRDEQETARNNKTLEILSGMSVAVSTVALKQDAHEKAMSDAIADMRVVTRRRKNDSTN